MSEVRATIRPWSTSSAREYQVRRFRVVFRPASGRRLLEDVDADDVRSEGAFLVFRRDVLVLRHPRTVVALRVSAATVNRVESRCPDPGSGRAW
jgi:hypothetical protein